MSTTEYGPYWATQEVKRLLSDPWHTRDEEGESRRAAALRLPYLVHAATRSVPYRDVDVTQAGEGRRQIRGEIEILLDYILGHFAANPSRPGTVEALRTTYAFPSGELPQTATNPVAVADDEDGTPNASEAAAISYLRKLAEAAKRARSLYAASKGVGGVPNVDISTGKFVQNKYLLIGEKGSGKTIFINYLLTAQHYILNQERVIWVRCDYTKDIPEAIEDRLRWQLCRVLATYYGAARYRTDMNAANENPAYRDQLASHWKEKLEANLIFDISGHNEKFFKRAREYKQDLKQDEFVTQVDECIRKLQSDTAYFQVPLEIAKGLFDWLAIDEEVAFLAVLDGLDQIGLTTEDKESYEERVKDLRRSLGNEKQYEMAWLVTMRQHTYVTSFTDRIYTRTFHRHLLSHVSAYDIWRSKLRLLEKPLPMSIGARRLSVMTTSLYHASLADICEIFALLITRSLAPPTHDGTSRRRSGPKKFDAREGFAILEGLFGTDRRALFRALSRVARFLFQHHATFFEKAIDHLLAVSEGSDRPISSDNSRSIHDADFDWVRRHHYLVIEALFLRSATADHAIPVYNFRWDKVGALKIVRQDHMAHTLYNLFHHPFRISHPERVEFLMGVRVLQYFRFSGGVGSMSAAFELLSRAFRYEEATLAGKFELLIEAGLISHRVEPGGSEDDLMLTDQGKFYLDRLLQSVAYLSLACHATPLPDDLARISFPVQPYRSQRAVPYNKLVCVINLCRVIAGVERREQADFNRFALEQKQAGKFRDVGSFESFYGNTQNSFAIASKICVGVIDELERMLHAASHSRSPVYGDMIDAMKPGRPHWKLSQFNGR